MSTAVLEKSIADFVRPVPQVTTSASIEAAVDALKSSPDGFVNVVDANRTFQQHITMNDLIRVAPGSLKPPANALELAGGSERQVAVRQDAKLWQLLKIMNGENALKKIFDNIPVLDEKEQACRHNSAQRLTALFRIPGRPFLKPAAQVLHGS
jgi:hypothetical protein